MSCHRPERCGILCNCHSACGAVAQLGERLNGIQEVVGSIPISSTICFNVLPLSSVVKYPPMLVNMQGGSLSVRPRPCTFVMSSAGGGNQF